MADFDIEAYLEQQVAQGAKSAKPVETAANPVHPEPREDGKDKKVTERSSSRDRKRSARSRSDSRSRRRHRDRSRDRSGSRSRKNRHRDSSRDRRDDSRERKRRDRDRSRDRKGRDRPKSSDQDRPKDKREPSIERKDAAPVPPPAVDRKRSLEEEADKERLRQKREIDELTKDQRTVFVSSLQIKVSEDQVKSYFSLVGKVNNVIMIRDKHTGRHKGLAYVEMAELESIPMCLQLNGIAPDFQKFAILVKASEAEKNFLAKKEAVVTTIAVERNLLPGADSKIYVGNLHVNISEDDLSRVLSRFGTVESINLQRDELGISKGYAFVKFARADEASKALAQLAGLELAGKTVKVGYVNDPANTTNASASSAGASGNWKLDDDEGTGMQMNAQSRSMLMAKLGAAAGLAPPAAVASIYGAGTVAPPGAARNPGVVAPPVGGLPSTCIVIKNMFVLEQETQPGWEDDIKEDVSEECRKHGKVNHCYIENKIPGGFVYLRFAAVEAASEAAQSLNGRWFAGRMITVSFVNPAEYQAKFNP